MLKPENTEHFDNEIWLPVSGYEGLYSVSSKGQIRSEGRVITRKDGIKTTYSQKILRSFPNPNYLTVGLTNIHGETKTEYVHVIVLTAFSGKRPDKYEACHNDGNRFNNSQSNLRWDSRIANTCDRKKHGTENTGERNGSAKLTRDLVVKLRARRIEGLSCSQLGKEFGISSQNAHKIATGKLWSHVK